MKRLLIALLMTISAFLLAEYQVFTYTAAVKANTPTAQKGAQISSIKLTGYLVTVACYPCGASFGKGYPSWLFITDSSKKTIWKLPCQVTGAQFGPTCDPSKFSDMAWLDPTAADRALAKKGNQYYCMFNAVSLEASISTMKAVSVELLHAGFGEGSTKTNMKTDDLSAQFNPYMKSCEGNVIGKQILIDYITWDPVNKYQVETAPIVGTFKLTFNATLTEKIRGTADWNKISSIIIKQMNVKTVIEEPAKEGFMWSNPALEF